LEQIEAILIKEKPDGVLVYGDTNSTLAGALAASKLHIPLYHVEAGLRSYNMMMPEEQNRLLTDHLADMLFCPTQTAVDNLKKEGIIKNIVLSGDIMFDSILRNTPIAISHYDNHRWLDEINTENHLKLDLLDHNYYLATIHRAENTDDLTKLNTIFTALNKLEKPVLMPLHPRTKALIDKLDIKLSNVIIIQPVGYLLMLYLLQNSAMAITDSGGLQKEAFFLKIPCTTLRDQTEWLETLENDWNVLSKIDVSDIIKHVNRDLRNLKTPSVSAFGDGKAALKIAQAILGETHID
ncbi:MAG: UDP-N-acetylglucosamine 2-epimerase (non-hydrolyzing), partial [Erysipelotrichaceae bacterium]